MRAIPWRLAALVLVQAGLWGQPLFGQDTRTSSPSQEAVLDRRIHQALHNGIREAVRHYDADRFSECCAAFRAGLVTVQAFLDHRPELQAEIRKRMTDTELETSHYQRAWALRRVIDHVQDTLIPRPPPPPLTLWERLGGERNVKRIVSDFIDSAIADPKVNFFRNGKFKMSERQIAELKVKLVQLASAAAGGPDKYFGKTMKEAHKGMGITDAEFDALLADLKLALLRNNVQNKDILTVLAASSITRPDIVSNETPPPIAARLPAEATLWERLGGEKNVQRIVDDFINGAIADPKVNFFRDGKHKMDAHQIADLKRKLVTLASLVSNGPYKYDGKTMAEAHKGMKITDAEFDAMLAQMRLALVRNEVKPADSLLIEKAIELKRNDIVEHKSDKPPMRPQQAVPESALPRPGTRNLDALVPADAEMVIQVNIRQVLGSALFEKHLLKRFREGLQTEETWQAIKAAGLDPLKDLDSLTLTTAGIDPPRVLIVLRGRFDPDQLNSALADQARKDNKLRSSQEGRLTIWEAQNNKDPLYSTVASPTILVISPDKAYLVKCVNEEGRNQPSTELKAMAGKVTGQESLWMVAVVTDAIKKQLEANPQTEKYAASLKAMTAVLAVTDALQLNIQVQTDNPMVAGDLKMMADQLKTIAMQLAPLQAGETLAPLIQEVLGKQLTINADKTTLNVDLKISEDQVKKISENIPKQ